MQIPKFSKSLNQVESLWNVFKMLHQMHFHMSPCSAKACKADTMWDPDEESRAQVQNYKSFMKGAKGSRPQEACVWIYLSV